MFLPSGLLRHDVFSPLATTLHITVDIIYFQALHCTDRCISWLNLRVGLGKCSYSLWLKLSSAIHCFGLNESEGVCLDRGQWRRANTSCVITVCRWKVQFKRDLSVYGRKWCCAISFDCWKCLWVFFHVSLTVHIAISPFAFWPNGKNCHLVKLLNVSRSLCSKAAPNWVQQSYRLDQCAGSATADWFTCWSDATKQALMKWIPSGLFALQKDLPLGISPSLFLVVSDTLRRQEPC